MIVYVSHVIEILNAKHTLWCARSARENYDLLQLRNGGVRAHAMLLVVDVRLGVINWFVLVSAFRYFSFGRWGVVFSHFKGTA